MITIGVTLRDGSRQQVAGSDGRSVMQAIRDAGLDELLALCGGCCACATCHVFVSDTYLDRLPPVGDDEDALLENSYHRTDASRLSCQLRCTPALDGLEVRIAPAE